MMRFHRRRLPGRKLACPEKPASGPAAAEQPANGNATDFAITPAPGRNQQDSTVELSALRPDVDPIAEPPPPKRLEFTCACGTTLVATPETYDKRTRCAMCQIVMLLNLVYDPQRRTHEIVPFRID